MHGAQAAIEPWRALHDALLALFPPKPKPFVIQFVEGFICRVCKASADAEEAAAAAEAKAKTEAEAAKAKAALEADEQSTEAVTKTPGAIDPADAANSPATPVEPKPAPAARPAPLLRESVHEHFAAPLHRADEPWRGFVGGNERFGFGRFDNRD